MRKNGAARRPPPKGRSSAPKTVIIGKSPSFWSVQVLWTWKPPVVRKGDTLGEFRVWE